MAYTFLQGAGQAVGTSLVESDMLESRARRSPRRRSAGYACCCRWITSSRFPRRRGGGGRRSGDIPAGKIGVDIGPETVRQFRDEIAKAQTIFWNGPMGIFEIASRSAPAPWRSSTRWPKATRSRSSAAAIRLPRWPNPDEDKITHISTGGGAVARVPRRPHAAGHRRARGGMNPSRMPLIAGNWKMHGTRPDAVALAEGIKAGVADVSQREVLVAPPFTALERWPGCGRLSAPGRARICTGRPKARLPVRCPRRCCARWAART